MTYIKSFSIAVLLTAFATLAFAGEPPARFDFVRPLGMGGAFTAVADDHNIFNFNPAGMVQRTGGQTTILEIAVGASVDTLDALDFFSDKEDQLTNFDTLTPTQQSALVNEILDTIAPLDPRVYVGADIASYVSGPNPFGLPFHLGFGAFAIVDSTVKMDVGASGIPLISFDVANDIIFPVSVAKRFDAPWILPGQLGVGFTGKLISRRRISESRIPVTILDEFDPPVATGFGYGSDIGILHQVNDRFNWGFMVRDFLGTNLSFDAEPGENGFPGLPERDSVIRPRTNIGIAVVPEKLFWVFPTTDRWTFSADIRDIFDDEDHILFEEGLKKPFGEDLYTHLHGGVEYRITCFRLRGGLNQGYATFGLGIDIPFIKLDYAFYQTELGDQAGDRRQENHIVSVAFRFGSGNVEARERITKAKQMKKERKMATPDEVPEAEPAAEAAEEKMEDVTEEVKEEMTEEIPE